MPRKQKDIYARIKDKTSQLETLKSKIKDCEYDLEQLNKEKDVLEMKQIFDTAKEHNLTVAQVIDMISKTGKPVSKT